MNLKLVSLFVLVASSVSWGQSEAGKKVYWTEHQRSTCLAGSPPRIRRANLDGTEMETIISQSTGNLTSPYDLAIDQNAGKIYWTDQCVQSFNEPCRLVRRANLDGTEIEDVISGGVNGPRGIQLDVAAGKLYFADRNGQIIRANLDGTEREELFSINLPTYALALDFPSPRPSVPAVGGVGLAILIATLLAGGGWIIGRRTGMEVRTQA